MHLTTCTHLKLRTGEVIAWSVVMPYTSTGEKNVVTSFLFHHDQPSELFQCCLFLFFQWPRCCVLLGSGLHENP